MTTTDEEKGQELLNGTLRQGVDSHRWAFQSLDGKAKAILTASTITLGIVMGGLGAGAGLAGGVFLPAWDFLAGVHLLLAYTRVHKSAPPFRGAPPRAPRSVVRAGDQFFPTTWVY